MTPPRKHHPIEAALEAAGIHPDDAAQLIGMHPLTLHYQLIGVTRMHAEELAALQALLEAHGSRPSVGCSGSGPSGERMSGVG